MTDRSKLLALAEAVEKLTGPDREVDAAIFQELNPTFLPVSDGRRFYDPETVSRLTAEKYITRGTYCTPNYTASLDAAMTLVPKGWGWLVSQPNEKAIASGLLKKDTPVMGEVQYGCDQRLTVAAATPALALTAASLRAQAEALS